MPASRSTPSVPGRRRRRYCRRRQRRFCCRPHILLIPAANFRGAHQSLSHRCTFIAFIVVHALGVFPPRHDVPSVSRWPTDRTPHPLPLTPLHIHKSRADTLGLSFECCGPHLDGSDIVSRSERVAVPTRPPVSTSAGLPHCARSSSMCSSGWRRPRSALRTMTTCSTALRTNPSCWDRVACLQR